MLILVGSINRETVHGASPFVFLTSCLSALCSHHRGQDWLDFDTQWCHQAAGHIHDYHLRARGSRGKYPAGSWSESFFVIMGIIDVEAGP